MTSSQLPAIAFRAVEPEDTDILYLWENMPEMLFCSTNHAPLSRKQIWDYTQTYDADPYRAGQLRLMVTDSDSKTIGCIDLYDINPYTRRAFIGILVSPTHRDAGYGHAILQNIISYCRNALNLRMLAAIVATSNLPSQKIFTASGFKTAAVLPQWLRKENNGWEDAKLMLLTL